MAKILILEHCCNFQSHRISTTFTQNSTKDNSHKSNIREGKGEQEQHGRTSSHFHVSRHTDCLCGGHTAASQN
ncbi:hypothetical protein Pcinc_003635 [Petrolisthes cinctipes]|uniref:Uncharacterized protein n=1 Tax=Petrolisthes cinctipes TaxID=88211 RepID=A0AAE1L142_PETCI|nr:hypothetical protein Pcinc_003635 [Petrolisthes cinctipes]